MTEPRRSSRANKGQHTKRDIDTMYGESDDEYNQRPSKSSKVEETYQSDEEYVDQRKTRQTAEDVLLEDEEEEEPIVTTKRAAKPEAPKQPTASSFDSLRDKTRKGVAKVFNNLFLKQIPDTYASDKAVTAEKWALELESVLHNTFKKDSKHYTDKSRSTMTLVKKPNVFTRILGGTLTFQKLILSSPEEIDEDLRIYAQKVREEAIRRSVLTNDNEGQRIRRTHKGDELVDDYTDSHRAEEADLNIITRSVDHRIFQDDQKETTPTVPKERENSATTYALNSLANEESDEENYEPSDHEGDKLDDDDLFDKIIKTEEKVEEKPAKPVVRSLKSALKQPVKSALKKASISEADLKPNGVWQGQIIFPDFVSFKASSEFVTSTGYYPPRTQLDIKFHNNCIDVSHELFSRSEYDIPGKLKSLAATSYLNQVVTSRDIYLFRLDAVGDSHQYDKLFNYLLSESRTAVLSGKPRFVKDSYIVALNAGSSSELPEYLRTLNNIATLRGLFAVFVVQRGYVSASRVSVSEPVKFQQQPTKPAPAKAFSPLPATTNQLSSILSKLGGGGVQSNANPSPVGPNLPPKPAFMKSLGDANSVLSSDQMSMLASIVQQNPQAQGDPNALASLLQERQNTRF